MLMTTHRRRRLDYGASGAIAAAVVALALGAAVVGVPELIALCVPLAAGLLALSLGVRRVSTRLEDDLKRQVLAWTIASLFLHLVAGLVITHSDLSLYLGPDAFIYHRGATGILRHWTSGFPFPDFVPGGKEGFYYVLASLYWVVGVSTSAGLALNATLAAALVPILTDTAHRMFGPDAARRVPPMAVLLPGLFVWSTQLLKEACVLFLIAAALNCAVRLSQRVTPGAIVVLTGALASLMTFRGQLGFVLTAGVLVGLTLGRRHLLGGLGTALGALTVMVVLVAAIGLGYAGYRVAIDTDLEQAQLFRSALATSVNSGFAADSDISTPVAALSFLPRGLAAMLLGPFPWEVRGIRQWPALADVLVWWALLPSLWRGRRGAGRQLLLLVIPAVAATIVLSLAISNYGTVVRERTQIVVMTLPMIAFGLSQRRGRPTDVQTPEPTLASLDLVSSR